MTNDRYTKAVLTVIAGALLYICAMLPSPAVSAQTPPPPFGASQLSGSKPQPVVIVGWGTMAADGDLRIATVRDRNGVRTDPNLPIKWTAGDEPVPVTLDVTPDHPLPVGITSVKAGAAWEPIRAKVEPQPGQAQPGIPR